MLQRIHLALSVSAANLILYVKNNLLTFFSLWREIYLLYALIKTLTVCFLLVQQTEDNWSLYDW